MVKKEIRREKKSGGKKIGMSHERQRCRMPNPKCDLMSQGSEIRFFPAVYSPVSDHPYNRRFPLNTAFVGDGLEVVRILSYKGRYPTSDYDSRKPSTAAETAVQYTVYCF
jgi:hypothetical protein